MAYTQAQINAALAAELAARPNTPQAELTAYAKANYGLTDAQLNAAYDTIAGFNAQGQWDANDYMANRVSGTPDPKMVVDAAREAAKNELRTQGPQQFITDPITGQVKSLTWTNPDFNPNDQLTLAMLGSSIGKGDTNADSFFAANPSYVQKAKDAWATEFSRLQAIDRQAGLLDTPTAQTAQTAQTYTPAETALYNAYRSGDYAAANRAIQSGNLTSAQVQSKFGLSDADMAWMANNAGIKFYSPTTTTVTGTGTVTPTANVVNADGSVTVGNKTYSAAEAALYNAYRAGNMAEFNRLTALNKFTLSDIQSKFGLTDADMNWIKNNAGGQFYSPTGTVIPTGITGIINTIAGNQNQVATQTAPVGQFRELFPSFAESKRLAGQVVANRPTTESIISMINSNAARPVTVGGIDYSAPEAALYNAYRAGNMPEFNRLTQANQLTAPNVQSKFGLTDADMSWITNNAGGVFYNPTGTQQVAPPSLNNVLSMISK
jgi:alkylated DNA repair dioxygenase AlkB